MAAKTFETALIITGDGTGAAKAIKLTREQLEQLSRVGRATQGDLNQASSGGDRLASSLDNVGREANRAYGMYDRFKEGLRDTAVYGGIALAIGSIGLAMAKVLEVGNKMQGLEASFSASFGGLEPAKKEIGYVKDLANDLGLEFTALGEDYGKWAASVNGTALAGEQQKKIFESVASAAKVLNLSADDTSGALRAMAQMVSKGKVQAEELRGQLGERLPGAFQMAARAMGVTTAELNKMLELGKVTAEDLLPKMAIEINKTFGGAALDAAKNNFASNTNRMINSLTELANTVFVKVEPALSSLVGGIRVVAEHEEMLFTSIGLLSAFVAGRAVSALFAYVAAKHATITATRLQAVTEQQAAIATTAAAAQSSAALAARATNEARVALLARSAAAANLENARATLVAATATANSTAGLVAYQAALTRVTAAQAALRASSATLATARAAEAAATATATTAATAAAAAQGAAATATGAFAAASRGLATALALVGGPVGAIMLAFGAAIVYREELMGLVTYSGKAAAAEEHHAEAMTQAKDAAYLYAEASEEVRKNLDAQKNAALNAARASIDEAKAAVEAAKTKLSVAQAMTDGGSDAAVLSGFGSTDTEEREVSHAEKMLEIQGKALTALEERYNQFGKTKQELDKAFAETPPVVEAATAAMESNAAATATTSKAASDHDKALQGVIENLTKQRIELEHGKTAAEYYTNRLNGLTDAEARAAAGAGQYNTYLAERKKLQQAAIQRSGNLVEIYRAQLEESGLGDISSQFDAIKASTDRAVEAAQAYKASLQEATTAGAAMGNTVAASTEKASSSIVAAMQKQADEHAKTIEVINRVSAQSGVDPTMMKTMAWIESRFNEKAYNKSSASGVYQFVNGTARQYGLSGQQFDPEANTKAYVKLLNDNMAALKRYGIQVSAANLYLAHQQGSGGLKQIMDEASGKGAMSDTVRRNMLNNRPDNMSGTGAGDFLAAWQSKYATIEASVKSVFGGTQAIATATAQATTNTQALAGQTAVYTGEIDSARVSQDQINGLVADYMQGQADELIEKAAEHAKQLELGAYAYRKMQLEAQKFNATQVKNILQAESTAKYKELTAALDDKARALTMNADAYRAMQLAREEGLGENEAKALVAYEKEIEYMGKVGEAIDDLETKLTDAFMDAIETGKLKFDDLKSWLKDTFNNLVLRPMVQYVTSGISGFVQNMIMPAGGGGGVAGAVSGMTGGQGGIGGLMSGLTGANGLFGSNGLIFGNSIGNAFGGIGDALGTSLFSNAGASANWMYGGAGLLGGMFGQAAFGGQGGIGGGLGATLGMAVGGPLGALAGGVLGGFIGGLFGGERETTGQGVQLGYGGGNFSGSQYSTWSEDGGWFGDDESGTDYTGLDSQITTKINEYFDAAEKNILKSAEYFGYTTAQATMDSFTIAASMISTEGKSGDEIAKIVEDWANGVRSSMYKAVFGADFDSFQLEGEELSATFDRLILEIESVKVFSKNLGLEFGLTGKAAAQAADTIALAAGGLETLNSLVETYYQNYYTEQERLQNQYINGKSVLMAFNEEMGTAIDGKAALRSYVDALDLTTAAGQKAFAAAMQLSPALLSMTQAQEALLNQTLALRNALLEIQAGDLSILTPVKKLDEARKQFEELYTKAVSGDQDAINAIAGSGQALLQLSRAYNASGAAYTTDYSRVTDVLGDLATSIETEIKNGMGKAVVAADVSFDKTDSFAKAATATEKLTESVSEATTGFGKLSDLFKKFGTNSDDSTLDGSHASGLASVPFDGYRAELHKGEAVIDHPSISVLREYGVPVMPVPMPRDDDGALLAEVRALRNEVGNLRSEIATLRATSDRHGNVASMQREEGNRRTAEMQAELQRTREQQRAQTRLGAVA